MVTEIIENILDNIDYDRLRTPEEDTRDDSNSEDFIFGSLNEYDSVQSHQLEVEPDREQENPSLSGCRIVNLAYFLQNISSLQYEHAKICTTGKMLPYKEIRDGLSSSIIFKCNLCLKELTRHTEDPNKKILNTAAVWGTLATGSTFGYTEELLLVMDIPMMSARMFNNVQIELGEVWKDALWKDMEMNGIEER